MKQFFESRKITHFLLPPVILAWLIFSTYQQIHGLEGPLELYSNYNFLAKLIGHGLSLSIVTLFLIIPSREAVEEKKLLQPILTGFVITALFGVITVLAANPDGRFPWGNAPHYIHTGARVIKPRTYQARQEPTQILVIGSSRAFSISSKTLQETYNLPTYNMSVETGNILDFLSLTNFILAHQPEAPLLILAEVGPPTLLRDNGVEIVPMSLTGYLPIEKAIPAVWENLKLPLTCSSFSDALFTWTILPGQKPDIYFQPEGHILASPVAPKQYLQAIKRQTTIFHNNRCHELPEDGLQYLDNFIALAEQQKIAVVFYTSPITSDVLENPQTYNKVYQKCERLVKNYLIDQQTRNDHIFFQDVASEKQISDLRSKGFTDSWHLTSYGAQKVLEALAPTIQSALQWAEQARQK